MTQSGPRKQSIDQIVQKIKKSNQDKQQVSEKPERTNEQIGTHTDISEPQTSTASKEHMREPTQKDANNDNTQPKRDDMTIITIPDSPHSKATILLESGDNHPTTDAPIQAPLQLQAAAESTRIFQRPSNQQISLTMDMTALRTNMQPISTTSHTRADIAHATSHTTSHTRLRV